MFVHLIVLWRHIQSGWRLYEKYACTNINHTIYGINIVDQNSHKEHVSSVYNQTIVSHSFQISQFEHTHTPHTRNNMYDRIRIWCTAHGKCILPAILGAFTDGLMFALRTDCRIMHTVNIRIVLANSMWWFPSIPPTRPKTLCCYERRILCYDDACFL